MIHATGTFKGWIPGDLLDESVPACRARPDDWLVRGDTLRLASRHEAFEDPAAWYDPEDPFCIGRPVADGDRVAFEGLTKFGTVRVRIDGADAYGALDPVPEGATQFWLPGDMDTMAYGLDEFVKSVVADGLDLGSTLDVDCYDWTERVFVFRDGVFHELTAAEARPQ